MAASSPMCAPLGLLLLIVVVSFHLHEVQARPFHFWCGSGSENLVSQTIEVLDTDMAKCKGSDMLPSPVQLPCVSSDSGERNKPLQETYAEVKAIFQMFHDSVQAAKNQTTLDCQISVLKTMEHYITNYLQIMDKAQIQNPTVTPADPVVQICSAQTSLRGVCKALKYLLRGKLRDFVVDFQNSSCGGENMTVSP